MRCKKCKNAQDNYRRTPEYFATGRKQRPQKRVLLRRHKTTRKIQIGE
jgi:hypothetical protein